MKISLLCFFIPLGMNCSVEVERDTLLCKYLRVGCANVMKFFLQKSSISTHILSLTGRGMVVGEPCFYQHFIPNGTGNGGGKIVPLGTKCR
jgi:hypothetical protein